MQTRDSMATILSISDKTGQAHLHLFKDTFDTQAAVIDGKSIFILKIAFCFFFKICTVFCVIIIQCK